MVWRVWLLVLLMVFLSSAQEIHLKARSFSAAPTAVKVGGPGILLLRQQAPAHRILTFDHPPTQEDIALLLESGLRVLAMVPDNSLMVSGSGVQEGLELTPSDKLSPALEPGTQPVVIEFHSDVMRPAQNEILDALGLVPLRPDVLDAAHVIALASTEMLRAIAGRDEVAYIFPADPAMADSSAVKWMNCVGMLTTSGPVSQYAGTVHGWSPDALNMVRLNYVFGNLTAQLPEGTAKQEVLRAFNEWSRNTGVIFQAGSSATAPRTITVEFVAGAHGDYWPFTSSATIAHTFYPVPVNAEPAAGDMHLNLAETWNAGRDIDIFSVVLHEAGHALGLPHSDVPGDVMYPYYRRGMQLSSNDIHAIQALYGTGVSGIVPAVDQPSLPEIQLSINPVSPVVQKEKMDVGGMRSGGVTPVGMQWQTDHGAAGTVTAGAAGTWSVTNIPLMTGMNTITVSAFDSAHQTVSATLTVTRLLTSQSAGTAPVALKVVYPASSVLTTDKPIITISGTAAGGTGVNQVIWQTSSGPSGTAAGTNNWSIAAMPLMTGANTILLRAVDARGASAWTSLVVVRR